MKVVVLYSGGLDSTLALKVILDQGLDMVVLSFRSPFCRCDPSKGCRLIGQKKAGEAGVEFKTIYLGQEYLAIVKDPKYGHGKNLNPCIDCRILMLKQTKIFMQEVGASFIVTGEVVGQRPKSQHKKTLRLIEKESGLEGLIVRPLSAKLLPPTIAEKKGWIKRESLFDICGRSRKPQMKMATHFGIKNYPCPAGGCLLTDPSFCRRLKDLMHYSPDFNCRDIELLKLGRHFRLSKKTKLIIARDEREGNRLEKFFNDGVTPLEINCKAASIDEQTTKKTKLLSEGFTVSKLPANAGLSLTGFIPQDIRDPRSLGVGEFRQEDFQLAYNIIVCYCQKDGAKKVIRVVEREKENIVEVDGSGVDMRMREKFLI